MPSHQQHSTAHAEPHEDDVEQIVRVLPLVLPLIGAGLIFLLAFIAVYMA
ncbi:MAG TPA: hypothetical protein VFE74_00530 [Ramlibacter sp.]|jgi:hypothetical protein|nr:hypothetical protein [Ramlibacter sp.]